MAKIKWESKQDKESKKADQEKFKGKQFKTFSAKEKDELLERIARQLGYL